jgi:hypothetical protein
MHDWYQSFLRVYTSRRKRNVIYIALCHSSAHEATLYNNYHVHFVKSRMSLINCISIFLCFIACCYPETNLNAQNLRQQLADHEFGNVQPWYRQNYRVQNQSINVELCAAEKLCVTICGTIFYYCQCISIIIL